MPNSQDLKRGVRFEHDGVPYTVVDLTTQSPSARGGTTLVKVKARELIGGALRSFSFKTGERLGDPNVELSKSQFLYSDGEDYHFMDNETYDQCIIKKDELGGSEAYLLEGMEVRVMFYDERPVSIEVPNVVDLMIEQTDPGMKGDTVTNVTKAATLETGLVVQVPLFINPEDKIRVDTRDARYIERVKK